MNHHGHGRLIARLSKMETRLLPKPPVVDGRYVWARLAPLMKCGDSDAVRRALDTVPTWGELAPTMAPEHVAVVLRTFVTEDWVRGRTGPCTLARVVSHALAREWGGPLALPAEVAEVYLREPETLPLHTCTSCGYRTPTFVGHGYDKHPAYFSRCPLCAGRVRWCLLATSESPVGPDGLVL